MASTKDRINEFTREYNNVAKSYVQKNEAHLNYLTDFFAKDDMHFFDVDVNELYKFEYNGAITKEQLKLFETPHPASARYIGIQRKKGTYDIFPNMFNYYDDDIHDTLEGKKLFDSNYDQGKGGFVEGQTPANITINKDGTIKINKKGSIELHEKFLGSDPTLIPSKYTTAQSDSPNEQKPATESTSSTESPQKTNTNEQTPPPEKTGTPSAKPEPSPETPVNTESPLESPRSNVPSRSSYDFDNAKQNMLDKVNGIAAEHKVSTSPITRGLRRGSMQNEDIVNMKRFDRARTYYKQNMSRIQVIDRHLNDARAYFSEEEQKNFLSDENIEKMNKELGKARVEYDSVVLDAKRAGTKIPEYNSRNINEQVAQKVFGNTNIESINAVQYADLKTAGDNLKARYQRRNDIIGRAIDPALERNENKIARGPKAGSSGWKGKAAIFGGVALGALALVGVANMAMSGGRQSNSNLYNPYQAMY